MEKANSIYILARSVKGENRVFRRELKDVGVSKEAPNIDEAQSVSCDLNSLLPDGFSPLLIGGFSTLLPRRLNDVPVSAAFKLNGDIPHLSDDYLLDLALAEFSRVNGDGYRSYTIEPDNRVAVISREAQALSRFIEVWGGVLDITPLLLDAMHPGFTCVKDVTVTLRDRSLRMEFLEPSPIDLQQCTRCGACSWVCPEGCIAPGPFLDLGQCSLCGKCKEVCKDNAIDLHASIRGALEVPYLVLLQGVAKRDLDIENAQDPVFTEAEIEDLISNLFPQLVEEVVALDKTLCQYSPRPATGCTKCIDVCPSQAIGPDGRGSGGLDIDHLECNECGACVAICPTGAVQYKRFSDSAFYAFLKAVAKGMDPQQGLNRDRDGSGICPKCLVIAQGDALFHIWWMRGLLKDGITKRLLFMEHPLPTSLSLPHFLAFIAAGLEKVLIVIDGESSEDVSLHVLMAQIKAAMRIVESLGLEFTIEVTDRREAIETLNRLISLDLYQVGNGNMAREAWAPDIDDDGETVNKRVVMSSILDHLLSYKGETTIGTASPLFGDEDQGLYPFQDLELDGDRCTHCLSCLNECKIGAFQAHESEMTLGFKPILCIACGTCIDICPEGALKAVPGLRLDRSFLEEKVLFSAEPARCKGCGKVFGTRKSLERVKAILASRGQLDEDLMDLCEDCRVKKLFET